MPQDQRDSGPIYGRGQVEMTPGSVWTNPTIEPYTLKDKARRAYVRLMKILGWGDLGIDPTAGMMTPVAGVVTRTAKQARKPLLEVFKAGERKFGTRAQKLEKILDKGYETLSGIREAATGAYVERYKPILKKAATPAEFSSRTPEVSPYIYGGFRPERPLVFPAQRPAQEAFFQANPIELAELGSNVGPTQRRVEDLSKIYPRKSDFLKDIRILDDWVKRLKKASVGGWSRDVEVGGGETYKDVFSGPEKFSRLGDIPLDELLAYAAKEPLPGASTARRVLEQVAQQGREGGDILGKAKPTSGLARRNFLQILGGTGAATLTNPLPKPQTQAERVLARLKELLGGAEMETQVRKDVTWKPSPKLEAARKAAWDVQNFPEKGFDTGEELKSAAVRKIDDIMKGLERLKRRSMDPGDLKEVNERLKNMRILRAEIPKAETIEREFGQMFAQPKGQGLGEPQFPRLDYGRWGRGYTKNVDYRNLYSGQNPEYYGPPEAFLTRDPKAPIGPTSDPAKDFWRAFQLRANETYTSQAKPMLDAYIAMKNLPLYKEAGKVLEKRQETLKGNLERLTKSKRSAKLQESITTRPSGMFKGIQSQPTSDRFGKYRDYSDVYGEHIDKLLRRERRRRGWVPDTNPNLTRTIRDILSNPKTWEPE